MKTLNKFSIPFVLCLLLAGCAMQPQAAPRITSVSMEIGDSLPITCDGMAIVVDSTLHCNPLPATHTPVPGGGGAGNTIPPTATFTPEPTATATTQATSTPEPTGTPTATATNTPLLVATFTPLPTATNAAPITAFAGAPLCETHNPDFWHGLWDDGRGCHYDHEHGADPNGSLIVGYPIAGTNLVMDSIRELQGGVDLGYVWQTTNENLIKHEGYKGQSAVDVPCEQQNYLYMPTNKRDCIRGFSVMFHHGVAPQEGYGRFHSASVYAQVCARDGSWCGDVFTGGLSDTGDLHSKYKTTCQNPLFGDRPLCPTDSTVWAVQLNNPGYWAYNDIEEAQKLWTSGDLRFEIDSTMFPSPRRGWSNYSSDRTPSIGNRGGVSNFLFHINARDYRESGYYDKNTRTFKYFCPLSDCVATSSAVFIYALVLELPKGLPVGADGFINYSGYTNRAGKLVTNCTAPGVECVPLRIRNVKPNPGLFIYDMTPGFLPNARTWGDGVVTTGPRYFDTTPAGVKCEFDQNKRCSWIKLPEPLYP